MAEGTNTTIMIEKFEELLLSTNRKGIEKLIPFIRKSDFYTAPASTRFHSCHEGGLLEHSLAVYECLNKKKNSGVWKNALSNITDANIIISALLHDICKSFFYVIEFRNKKIYSDTGSKRDSNGRFDWESVPSYTVDDKFPLGHGDKSVIMLSEFINLEKPEMYAIRWHMGFSEPKENWGSLGNAMRKYPLVLALSESDLEATYLLEKEG